MDWVAVDGARVTADSGSLLRAAPPLLDDRSRRPVVLRGGTLGSPHQARPPSGRPTGRSTTMGYVWGPPRRGQGSDPRWAGPGGGRLRAWSGERVLARGAVLLQADR